MINAFVVANYYCSSRDVDVEEVVLEVVIFIVAMVTVIAIAGVDDGDATTTQKVDAKEAQPVVIAVAIMAEIVVAEIEEVTTNGGDSSCEEPARMVS